jgi:hypothetical protein
MQAMPLGTEVGAAVEVVDQSHGKVSSGIVVKHAEGC